MSATTDLEYKPTPYAAKLTEISEVMSDGYFFCKARFLLEDVETKAQAGDELAQEFLRQLDTFHRFCKAMKGN